MSSQKTDLFKRPSFEQPFSPITNRKRRGPSVTFAEGTKSPNSPAHTPKRFVDIRSFCQGPNVAFAVKAPNSPAVPYANSLKHFAKSNGGATENSHPLEQTSSIHNSAVGTSVSSLEPQLVTSTSNEHSKLNIGNSQNSPKCFLEDSGDITSDGIYLLGLTPNIHNGAGSTSAFLKSALITSTPNEHSSLVTNIPNPANPPNRSAEDSEDVTLDNVGGSSGQHSWLPQGRTPDTRVAVWTHDARALREANKNLRQIYQDEGLSYGKDVSAAELKSRMSRAIKLRQASVAKMFKLLYASRDVQLCFLVDVTGSMDRHIKGVRDSIFKIVEKLLEKHVSCAGHSAIAKKVSLAFVGYRDFLKTGKNSKNHFELLPFTEKAESFREFCRKIHATGGGGDRAEDVFGGLEKAISNLRWDDASMGTKVIFHIGDHPCHGKDYQTAEYIATKSDNFPDGDPGGRTVEELFSDLREKGIQYHFGRIDWCTDRMIALFSEAAGYEIVVFDSKNVSTLVDNVVSSVSIGTSIRPGMRAKPHIKTDNWAGLIMIKLIIPG